MVNYFEAMVKTGGFQDKKLDLKNIEEGGKKFYGKLKESFDYSLLKQLT